MSTRPSTPVTIPATTAHRRFGELVRRAFSGREHFIVEKDGLPVVAIISMAEYEELIKDREEQERRREERLKRFRDAARHIGEEVERQGLSEEDVEATVEQVRQRLYEEDYGRKPAE